MKPRPSRGIGSRVSDLRAVPGDVPGPTAKFWRAILGRVSTPGPKGFGICRWLLAGQPNPYSERQATLTAPQGFGPRGTGPAAAGASGQLAPREGVPASPQQLVSVLRAE